MRQMFAGILILVCVFILGAVSAAENQMGIRDSYSISFSEKVRVADTLLPQGNYEIRHVMEGHGPYQWFCPPARDEENRLRCARNAPGSSIRARRPREGSDDLRLKRLERASSAGTGAQRRSTGQARLFVV